MPAYISPGKFELIDKPKPELQGPRDGQCGDLLRRVVHLRAIG